MKSSTFFVSINLGNDGMQCPGDVSRALREIAATLDSSDGGFPLIVSIKDCNGNSVGWFGCAADPEK